MSILRHLRRLQFIDYLIQRKATGNLQTFAHKNRISQSLLMNILKEMKEMGFPIKYSRINNSYYYEETVKEDLVKPKPTGLKKLYLNLQELNNVQVLTREQLKNIGGVHNLCFSESDVFEKC